MANQRERLLHILLFTPAGSGNWGLPVIFWGAPGGGKTAMLEKYSARWGMHCESLSPATRGEGAFGVVPVPDESRKHIIYPAPDWVELVNPRGIVFLDELSTASVDEQKPMLGMLQSRRIGSHTLPPGARPIAASNPMDSSTGGGELYVAVANRLGHFDWELPNVDEWTSYMMGVGGDDSSLGNAADEEARVLKAWPEFWARATGLVTAFLARRRDLLHKMPAEGSTDRGRAWPSHRSWENATRGYASALLHGDGDIMAHAIVAGFVGNAAAIEFASWQHNCDLPDPAEVLDGKVVFKFDAKRLDQTVAVLASCAALVIPAKAERRKERAAALWGLIHASQELGVDVGAGAAKQLCRVGLGVSSKEALAALNKLEPVLAAAGIVAKAR